jgi:hypothetical protein
MNTCMMTKRFVAAALAGGLCVGCDKMQQQGPVPNYRSSALEAITPTLPGEQAAPASAALPPSAPAASNAAK